MSRHYFVSLVPSIGQQHLGGQGLLTQGKAIYVAPYDGSDYASGKSPDRALQTLRGGNNSTTLGAYNRATANQNDTIYMLAQSNTAASTTDYQAGTTTAALIWDKDLTHLVGVNGGNSFSQRSRVALLSTFDTAVPMVSWSADACLCANIQFFQGVAGTNPTGNFLVSGGRNKFFNCHFAGIGHANNNIASAYSLYVTGAENYFERCVIGLDTIDRSNAGGSITNYELQIGALASSTVFKDCIFVARILHATAHPLVHFDASTSSTNPSFVLFDNCTFINTSTNYAITATYVIDVATASGYTALLPLVKHSAAFGTTYWSNTGKKTQIVETAINTAYTGGAGYSA